MDEGESIRLWVCPKDGLSYDPECSYGGFHEESRDVEDVEVVGWFQTVRQQAAAIDEFLEAVAPLRGQVESLVLWRAVDELAEGRTTG